MNSKFKVAAVFFLCVSLCKISFSQSNPNIVDEDGYVVYADGDTIKGKISIEFKEKDEPGTTTLKSMDMGANVTINPYPFNSRPKTKQKTQCFFVRQTKYEPIKIKDGSALGFMSKMASGNPENVHFFKTYYVAGDFTAYQDPLDNYQFAIKKSGDEKAFYINDIFKNKKTAKSFIENCSALKAKIKEGFDDLKDVKLFADYLNTNCK